MNLKQQFYAWLATRLLAWLERRTGRRWTEVADLTTAPSESIQQMRERYWTGDKRNLGDIIRTHGVAPKNNDNNAV